MTVWLQIETAIAIAGLQSTRNGCVGMTCTAARSGASAERQCVKMAARRAADDTLGRARAYTKKIAGVARGDERGGRGQGERVNLPIF